MPPIVPAMNGQFLNVFSYYCGGITFAIGSIFFLPGYAKYPYYIQAGSWLFIIGSFFYLLVGGQDAINILWNHHHHRSPPFVVDANTKSSSTVVHMGAPLAYILGALCFIVGSVLFLPNIENIQGGAYSFAFGSFLFMVGGSFNCLQALELSPTFETAQYLVWIGISYTVGSTIFLCASIPYLFDFATPQDQTRMYRYLTGLYIVGSTCFVMGGFLNHRRTHLMNQYYAHEEHHNILQQTTNNDQRSFNTTQ